MENIKELDALIAKYNEVKIIYKKKAKKAIFGPFKKHLVFDSEKQVKGVKDFRSELVFFKDNYDLITEEFDRISDNTVALEKKFSSLKKRHDFSSIEKTDVLSKLDYQFENISILQDNYRQNSVALEKLNTMITNSNCQIEAIKKNDVNSKYPVSDNIKYELTLGTVRDIRDYIVTDNKALVDIIVSNNLKAETADETAYNCMMWVKKNIDLVSVPGKDNGLKEWLMPFETSELKKGYVEDHANLITSLMINAGVPSYRSKSAFGNISTGKHAWSLYLRESDNEWVVLDTIHNPTSKKVIDRELAKYRNDYGSIDFTVNNEHSWGEAELLLDVSSYRTSQIKKESIKESYSDSERIVFGYSIPLGLGGVLYPKSYDLFKVKEILEENNSGNWEKTFSKVSEYVQGVEFSSKEGDIEYMKSIKDVISKGLDVDEVRNDLTDRNVIKDLYSIFDNYISNSEQKRSICKNKIDEKTS